MALSAKVGAFNTGTGAVSTTVVVTGVGFQPKIILFWLAGRTETVDAVGLNNLDFFWGVAVSTTERWALGVANDDAAATTNAGSRQDATVCVEACDFGGSVVGSLDLQSMDSDGFTLVVAVQWPVSVRVHYLALGGADLTNVKASSFVLATVTGNQDVSGVGFQPDAVLLFCVGPNAVPTSSSTQAKWSMGAAVSSSQRGVCSGNAQDAVTTANTDGYCTDVECLAMLPSAGGNPEIRADFVSMLADGFRINVLENGPAANPRVFYIALKGGQYRVDGLLTQTDTVTDIVETGFGFQPRGALFASHCKAKSTQDTAQAGSELSVGAFDSITSRGAQGFLDEDATAGAEIETILEHDEIYANVSSAAAIEGLMDIKSVDADGFTCIMDDADPAQAFVWYLAFGDAPSVGGQPSTKRAGAVPFMGKGDLAVGPRAF